MSDEADTLREALPGYDLSGELGRGGWGVVYGAEHRALERRVAIKALPVAFGADPATRERFRAEARVVASLDHPHIVPLFDFVERDDLCLFVMELMPGGTLWDRFSSDDAVPERACAVVLAMLTALSHAHERGVLHRDVKPENVLFNAAGVPKLADFGIAKVLDEGTGTRTATGVIMGTPAYMAPEQASGEPVTPATDTYAVGVMLYELLSGQLPFDSSGGAMSLLYRHAYEEPAPLRQLSPTVAPRLAEVVMTALAKAPGDRHESAGAFAASLDRAATAALGSDWLTRSGIPVLASKDVFDTAGDPKPSPPAAGAPPPPPAAGAPPPPAAGAPPPPAAPAQAGPAPASPSTPAATGDVAPASGAGAPSAGAGAPTIAPPSGPRRRTWVVAGAAAVVLAVVAALSAMMLTSGGDDAPVQVTRAAEARFRDACRANDVDDEVCSCALDRSLARLTPEQFRANDELLARTGDGLTAEVDAIFDECVEELG